MARMKRRTIGWWVIRVEFLLAIEALALWWLMAENVFRVTNDDRVELLGFPAQVVAFVACGAGILFGIAWMFRIARGPRDEPPAWRYRDR